MWRESCAGAVAVGTFLVNCSSAEPSGERGVGGMSTAGRDGGRAGIFNAPDVSDLGGSGLGGHAGSAGAAETSGIAGGGASTWMSSGSLAGTGSDTAGMSGDAGSGDSEAIAREHANFGADSESNTEQLAPMADGNVIQMNRSMILHRFSVSLRTNVDQDALFFVFEAFNWNKGAIVPRWTAPKAIKAGPIRDEFSPELSEKLEAGKTYWIGVSLPVATAGVQHGVHGAASFASSALIDVLALSPIEPPLPQSISLYMPWPPTTEVPVIETLELSLAQ